MHDVTVWRSGNALVSICRSTRLTYAEPASEVTTLWQYRNLCIIMIIISSSSTRMGDRVRVRLPALCFGM